MNKSNKKLLFNPILIELMTFNSDSRMYSTSDNVNIMI